LVKVDRKAFSLNIPIALIIDQMVPLFTCRQSRQLQKWYKKVYDLTVDNVKEMVLAADSCIK